MARTRGRKRTKNRSGAIAARAKGYSEGHKSAEARQLPDDILAAGVENKTNLHATTAISDFAIGGDALKLQVTELREVGKNNKATGRQFGADDKIDLVKTTRRFQTKTVDTPLAETIRKIALEEDREPGVVAGVAGNAANLLSPNERRRIINEIAHGKIGQKPGRVSVKLSEETRAKLKAIDPDYDTAVIALMEAEGIKISDHAPTPTAKHNFSPAALARIKKHSNFSLAEGLITSEPRMRRFVNNAKLFKFDEASAKKVLDLSETDWREWLPRAVVPYRFAIVEFPALAAWHKYKGSDAATDNAVLEALGVTGFMILGNIIAPLYRIMDRTEVFPGRIILTKERETLAQEEIPGKSWMKHEPDMPEIHHVWGEEYAKEFGTPDADEFQIVGNRLAGERMVYWGKTHETLGPWIMHMQNESGRRALAALALINAEHPVIEIEDTGGRDGRHIRNGKSVPRYTSGVIRLRPEEPRKVYTQAEQDRADDEERERIHKLEHDVRGHTRTYHRGTDKEFTIKIDEHRRGDPTLGSTSKHYEVGKPETPTMTRGVSPGGTPYAVAYPEGQEPSPEQHAEVMATVEEVAAGMDTWSTVQRNSIVAQEPVEPTRAKKRWTLWRWLTDGWK